DQEKFWNRDVRERGENRGRHGHSPAQAASVASASAASAALSIGKPAAIHFSSAAASAAPRRGPFSMPRLMKSFALSGKVGAVQRAGSVARLFHVASAALGGERAQAPSTRSTY